MKNLEKAAEKLRKKIKKHVMNEIPEATDVTMDLSFGKLYNESANLRIYVWEGNYDAIISHLGDTKVRNAKDIAALLVKNCTQN